VFKGSGKVDWGVEYKTGFDNLKNCLELLPTLSSLEQGQPLILYVSVTHSAASGSLVVEKETACNNKIAKQQLLLYFVSEVLTGSEKFYSEMEKICYADLMSVWKLRQYFEAYTIKILTNQPLNKIFGNRDSSGRISKWAMELSEYAANFEKCSTIKS
jgi:hypothetical protein